MEVAAGNFAWLVAAGTAAAAAGTAEVGQEGAWKAGWGVESFAAVAVAVVVGIAVGVVVVDCIDLQQAVGEAACCCYHMVVQEEACLGSA